MRPSARLKSGVVGIGCTPAPRELGAGVDGEHAGHRTRRVGIDRDDARVRVRRALEGEDRLALLGRVVDEAAAADQERPVLDARDRAAAAEARRGVGDCAHVETFVLRTADIRLGSGSAAHAIAAHMSLSRSAVQMRGSAWPVASSYARETSNGMQCS